MGLSSFPSAEGVLPILVMNTVFSVALLKNMFRSVLQVMGADSLNSPPPPPSLPAQQDYQQDIDEFFPQENTRMRRISITQFKSLTTQTRNGSCSGGGGGGDCCVCLCGFEAEEEVSELSCKHFFHKGCLDKWIDNKHSTCPLCRSIL